MTMFHFKIVRSIALTLIAGIMATSCFPGVSIPGNTPSQDNGTVKKIDDTAIGCEEIPAQNVTDSSTDTPTLNIEIHVDGSESMLGYVGVPNSRYSKTLEAVDQAFSLSSTNSSQLIKVSYFRTGYNTSTSESLQLLDRSQFQKSQEREFYTGRDNPLFPPISSQVNKAIESLSGGGEKLIVLVSDMGQDDGDVTSILQAIRSNIFLSKDNEKTEDNEKTDNALAIVGIKSEFNGEVYSPVNPNQYFVYSTAEKSQDSYRPFYLLIAGSSSDVQYFLNKLEVSLKSLAPDVFQNSNSPTDTPDTRKGINALESSLFDPNLLPALTLKTATVELERTKENRGKIREVYALQSRDLKWRRSESSASKALQILTNKPFSQSYQISLPGNNQNFQGLVNPVSPLSLDAESSVQSFEPSSDTFIETTESPGITIENLNLKAHNPLQLSFDFKIDPTNLIISNIYFYQFRFRAKELTPHHWWQQWDSPDSPEPNSSKGDKTYKLLSFLTGLNNLTANFMETGELCYAIQRK